MFQICYNINVNKQKVGKQKMKKYKYKIVVNYITSAESEIQEDAKSLSHIRLFLANDKCVLIGNTIYTVNNIISIEQI